MSRIGLLPRRRAALSVALTLAGAGLTSVANAQPGPSAPPQAPAVAPAAAPSAPQNPTPAAADKAPAPPSADKAPPSVPPALPASASGQDALAAREGTLTAEVVGRRAAETSYTAKAAEETVRAAGAKVDQAWAAFLPRLTGKFSYTRLSDFTPPNFGGFTIPLVLNQWSLEAQLVVPISDYFLRINQAYSAATKSQEAARLDVISARAKSSSDGKVAYYNWMRARGASVVAKQALEAARTHLQDAKNLFTVGSASKADVLRAETAVAGAELAVERTKNLAELTEKQVAVAIHAKEGETLTPGEGVDAEPPPFVGALPQLVSEAKANRYEVKSIDANAEAAKKQVAVVRGGAYPSLGAFAQAVYADPNQRRFPQVDANGKTEWVGTWALGAQLTWTPNDTVTSLAGAREIEAKIASAEQQKSVVRDGVELEVTQSFQAVKEADFALVSSKQQVASAEEAYRVARELFVNGRATSTTLTDAETELTRARLELVNAKIDTRTARVRLEHALGRDTRPADR